MPLRIHFGLEALIGPLLYGAAIITFLVSFARPALALYIMVPLLPFQTVRYRLHGYPLGHMFIDMMLLASLSGSFLRGRLVFPKAFLRTPLIAMTALTYFSLWKGAAYLSLPWPIWFGELRLDNWKNNVVVPVLVFVAVYSAIRTKRQMGILLLAMCATTAAFNRNVYNGIGQAEHESFNYQARAETGAIGSNGLAAFEVQLGFMLLALASFEQRRSVKPLYWALAVFCFYCVMLSYSRGAYVAFLAGWLALGITRARFLLLLLVAFLFSWQALVPNAVKERVLMTYTDGELEHSAAGRVTLWEDAAEVARVDPVFGVGYDTYEFMHRIGPYTDTHNVYMKVLVETGAVGLCLFLAIFWRIGRLGLHVFRWTQDPLYRGLGFGVVLWMLCAFLTNLFGDRWNYVEITGFLWAAAAMALRGLENEAAETVFEPDITAEDQRLAPRCC